MKKMLCILCAVLFLFSGCGNSSNNTGILQPSLIPNIPLNEVVPIYTLEHREIGSVEHHGNFIFAQDSIIYTKIVSTTDEGMITEMEYYRFIPSTGENIKLGSVSNWAYQSHDTALIDNHLYLYLSVIDTPRGAGNKEVTILRFFDIDLSQNTMTEIFAEKDGYLYNSLTAANGRIFTTKYLPGESVLAEYRPGSNELTPLKSYFNNEDFSGDSIQQIACDENTISILILEMHSQGDDTLRIDRYDHDMNFLYSVDASPISSDRDEIDQPVLQFRVSDDFVYYENLGSTCFLGKIEDKILKPCMEFADDLKIPYDTRFDEKRFDAKLILAEDVKQDRPTMLFLYSHEWSRRYLYLFDKKDEIMRRAEIPNHSEENKYFFVSAARDASDHMLVYEHYGSFARKGNFSRMYYFNFADLLFS